MKKIVLVVGIAFIFCIFISTFFSFNFKSFFIKKDSIQFKTSTEYSRSGADLSYIVVYGDEGIYELFDESGNKLSESYIQEPIKDPISEITSGKEMVILEYGKPSSGIYILKSRTSLEDLSIKIYLYDREGEVAISEFSNMTKNYRITFNKEDSKMSIVEQIQ